MIYEDRKRFTRTFGSDDKAGNGPTCWTSARPHDPTKGKPDGYDPRPPDDQLNARTVRRRAHRLRARPLETV